MQPVRPDIVIRRAPTRKSWLPVAAVTIGMALQRGFGALLPLVLSIVATRTGGFEAAGIVGVAAASALLVAAAADLGISQAAVRDFAVATPGRREMFALLRVKFLVGCIAASILAGGAYIWGSSTWAAPLMMAALAIPPLAVISLLTSKHAADGDGTILALAAFFAFAAGIITAIAAAVVSGEAWVLLLALPVARTVEATLLAWGLRLPRFSTRGAYGLAWIARAWPLSIVGLLQIAYLRGQVIIPGAILDPEDTGKVVDGFMLYSAATLLPGALGLAAWPAISRAAAESTQAAVRLALRFSAINLALVIIPVSVLIIVPGQLATLVYGDTSSDLETYLRWGGLATLFIAPNAVMLSLALSLNRERVAAMAWVLGLAMSAALTAVFTSEFGVEGAGFAVAASEVVLAGLIAWCISPSARSGAIASVLEPRVAAICAGVFAGAVAGLLTPLLAFPTPATGFLPLLVLPVLALAVIWWWGYRIAAPASIFVMSWTLALAIAQFPLFPKFNWNTETWVLLTVPPAVLALGAVAGAGRWGWSPGIQLPARLERPPVPLAVVAFCSIAGAVGWAIYFAEIGTVPLISGQIDVARFQSFGLTTLVGTRLGYVAVVASIPGFVLARDWRERALFVLFGALALGPMALSGGRLYPFSAVAIGGLSVIILRGVTLRLGMLGVAGATLLIAGSSMVFFIRVDQQPDNAFKQHLNGYLRPSRPDVFHWTIPVQMAASVSMHTLADLTNSHAYEMDDSPGLYSTKFLDRIFPARDLEQVTRPTARFSQVTTTFVGPWYADFGLRGVIALSFAWGLVSGLLYRWWRVRPSPLTALLYAYSAFWLVYALYLNYWAVHGVWLADVAFIAMVTAPAGSMARRARDSARRFEGDRETTPLEPAQGEAAG